MSRILAISSQVAYGAVGLSVIVPALQALGHDVIALPTVVLSNHPGHLHVSGTRISADVLDGILDALDANGWLDGVDGILTGYLPSVDHVRCAEKAVTRVRSVNGARPAIYLCDPVLGDDPKGLYIERAAAEEIRGRLVPMCDLATPNRFELSFLSRFEVRSAEDARSHPLGRLSTIATSIPSDRPGELLNVMTTGAIGAVARVPLRQSVPDGTGDLFSALLLAAWIEQHGVIASPDPSAAADPLAYATAGVDFALDGSLSEEAISVSALPLAATPLSWPVFPMATNRTTA